MAKDKIAYVCSNCGQESSKWIGKCPSCGQWNTFKEIRIANDTGSQAARNAGMSKTLEATMFGRPTDVKPLTLCGYYKYKPGAKFQNVKGKEVKDRIDKGSIYAVMYRNHDADGKDIVLHGDNVLTSDMIVGKAVLENVETTDEWIKFDVPFVFSEEINEDLLANRGYSLAVVFSSSEDGAKFEGAVGSTLLISKVRVACAKTE